MVTDRKRGGHILFIDDDTLNASAFAKRLERRGFSVEILSDGRRALEVLDENHFDLVLLDIIMPDIDGMTVLKQIRSKYPTQVLPVIMATILDDSTEIIEAFENGANDYITKPFNIDAAAARINGQLSVSHLFHTKMKLKEAEAVAALVITYHHELNNPLAIAKSQLQSLVNTGDYDESTARALLAALDRMSATLQRIKDVSDDNNIEYTAYTGNSQMLKIG